MIFKFICLFIAIFIIIAGIYGGNLIACGLGAGLVIMLMK